MPCLQASEIIRAFHARLPTTDDDGFLLDLICRGGLENDQSFFVDHEADHAAHHVNECVACQENLFPDLFPELVKIQKRMARYCCVNMFDAITNPEAKLRFQLTYFRDEEVWSINEEFAWVSYCPWCGNKLPNKSFE